MTAQALLEGGDLGGEGGDSILLGGRLRGEGLLLGAEGGQFLLLGGQLGLEVADEAHDGGRAGGIDRADLGGRERRR
jgi:hypothetical protein